MKKVITILIIIITIIIIGIFGIKVYIKKDEQKRYNEIKESVKKAVEWQIKATQPYCTLVHGIPDNMKSNSGGHMQSKHLINSGYIKKEELLDIDKKSYMVVDRNSLDEEALMSFLSDKSQFRNLPLRYSLKGFLGEILGKQL